MKIFVCEFITSGGLYREPLTGGLMREGLAMRDALLADLAELADIEVICCYDQRVAKPAVAHAVCFNGQSDLWHDLIQAADAVWMIAPETSGILQRMAELVAAQSKPLIGCSAAAITLASSKLATCRALESAGVGCVPTYSALEWPQVSLTVNSTAGWVVKPDDGVSCDDAVFIDEHADVSAWLAQGREQTHIVQPYRPGVAASMSMLCKDGNAWLLSCNRQYVVFEDGRFAYRGGAVNGLYEHWKSFDMLAGQIAQALPELAGYIGVDVIFDADNPLQLEVLEINPRLTTSYTGLKKAIGVNPAALILDLFNLDTQRMTPFSLPKITRNIVEITL